MSTTLVKQDGTAIKAHQQEERYFTDEQMKLLSDHIMKGASPIELQYFGEVCKRVGLDPFKKQIHAVQRWSNEAKRMVWSYQTGIDGYVAIAHRSGLCAGIEDIKFLPEDEITPNPIKATCTVWKIVGGQRVPFTASARWNEYVQTTKEGGPNSMWRKMPYGQLGKCAKSLALRMAFPEEIGGILTDVEMEQADSEGPRGEHVKGRPAQAFDLESRPFEQPAIAAPKPEPKPAPTPAPAKPQPAAEVPPIEAEVITALAVPPHVAEYIHGKWKDTLGTIKGKELAEARKAALEGENPAHAYAACASIYDEVQARLATKNMSEADFADTVCQKGVAGIEFPADLWGKLPRYTEILSIIKSLK